MAKNAVRGGQSIEARLLIEKSRRNQAEVSQAVIAEIARLERQAARLRADGKLPPVSSYLRGAR